MGTRDPRVDAYVAKSAAFAQPILQHLRELVHRACPEVEETMKWSFPNFTYKGMLCSMAGFKAHCSFGFWKGTLLFGKGHSAGKTGREGMGHLGRLTALADLPPDKVLVRYLREAMRLNESGAKVPRQPPRKEKLVVPAYFTAALKKNKAARATFEDFSYSHKKEYVEWVREAKTEETRRRRLDTTLAWLAEGKPRNWKYARCKA